MESEQNLPSFAKFQHQTVRLLHHYIVCVMVVNFYVLDNECCNMCVVLLLCSICLLFLINYPEGFATSLTSTITCKLR